MSQGNFVWYELSTTDVAGAVKFYGNVVGWETEKFPGPEPAYWIWKNGEKGIGGLMALTAFVALGGRWRTARRGVA